MGRRPVWRWLIPAAGLAVMPKCLLCVATYFGLGAALGLSGPEICGASAESIGWTSSAIAGIGGLSGLAGCVGVITHRLKAKA